MAKQMMKLKRNALMVPPRPTIKLQKSHIGKSGGARKRGK